MSKSSFLKTAAATVVVALAATAAVVSFSTTAPAPAQADIPPAVLAQAQAGTTPSLAPMLKTVLPAVVNISVTSKVQEQQNPLMQDPFFRRFFNIPDQRQPREEEAQAIGSGVIVDADKGYVVTNNHVVDQADSIKVKLNDDREYDAKLIGKDPGSDLAIVQIKADNLKQLPIADSDQLQVGDFVVAIGSPFALQQTVTSGIVSGLGRTTDNDGIQDFIQTDASINPGNSGGALVNLRGELVGVPSQILSRSGGNMGIGFAIPTNVIKSVMTQLIATGSVNRGRIGIGIQPITPALAKALGLKDTHGALVRQVEPGSPAAKAGIKVKDVIVAANGREMMSDRQLHNTVALLRVGDKVDLKLLRDGQTKEITVAVGKADDKVVADAGDGKGPGKGAKSKLQGATVGPVTDGDGKGVQITAIDPGTPAARAGLREGDVITSINNRNIDGVDDFSKAIGGTDDSQLLLQVRRGNNAFFLVLQ